ncbi:MAG: hypothetical protein R2865_15440 [Deinococcales bacterium]
MNHNLVLKTSWHDESRRKLEAARACQEGDVDKLIDLTLSYLSYRGRKGSRTRPKTFDTYSIGIKDFYAYCWPDKEAHLLCPS